MWSYMFGLMKIKGTLTLLRKESKCYVGKLVKFGLQNHESHSEDIETW